jgi:8-oxo-dGTP pyrophosphatase MutT (NUDIX family)
MVGEEQPRLIGEYAIDEIVARLGATVPLLVDAPDIARRASVAMILRPSDAGELEVAFIRRAVRAGDPWSGQMAFPGGHVERDDVSIEAAAPRETCEEIGLTLGEDALIGRLDEVDARPLRDIIVSAFVYRCDWYGTPVLSEEVSELVWVPLAFLGAAESIGPYHAPGYDASLKFPSYAYGEYVIWGMTSRIIGDFMRRFGIDLPLPDPRDVK